MFTKNWKYAAALGLIRLAEEGGEGGDGEEGGDNPPEGQEPKEKQEPSGRKAPWGEDDFDAVKASKLFENLTADKAKLQVERDELKKKHDEAENAKLSDQQRTEKERDEARGEVAPLKLENARLRALIKHGLEEEDLSFISGTTAEEIEANAAKYAERHGAGRKGAPPTQKSKPHLRGGTGAITEGEEMDPRKLAASIPRN